MLFNGERNSEKHKNLQYEPRDTCNAHKIYCIKYVCDDKYARACKTIISNPRCRQIVSPAQLNMCCSNLFLTKN